MRSSPWISLSLLLSACAGSTATVVAPPGPHPAKPALKVSASIVSVVANRRGPDWSAPWSMQRPWTSWMTGLVLEGHRILVTGAALGDLSLAEVLKQGQPQRWPATVELIDYEIPLAVLKVEDPKFWEGLVPLPIASEVPRDGNVTIHRWLGSGQLEDARGKVRQVTVQDHWPGRCQVLSLDVSSSIDNAGASEVLISHGQVIGLSTSKSEGRLNAIAAPVLKDFLDDVDHPPYRGLSRGGFTWEGTTNPALRRYLGLQENEGGMRITRILPHGSMAAAGQPGDVILEVEGHPVDTVGQFEHDKYGRLPASVLYTEHKHPGDPLKLKLLRQGQRIEVQLKLVRMTPEQERVIPYSFDKRPEYFVKGGLLFQHLSRPYLGLWKEWWRRGPLRLLIEHDLEGENPTPEHPRRVILSRVLADAVNLGYHDVGATMVDKVNGVAVRNLDDVRAAFQKPVGEYHIVELISGGGIRRLVLDAAEVEAAEPRIRRNYGITD
ncbi:MAG: hypothetical protein U1E65_00050 [Myxococcota bacterium]